MADQAYGNARPPSYGAILFALEELPIACRAVRRMRGLSLRDAAEEIGIGQSNIHRFEREDGGYNSDTLRLILGWLDSQHRPAQQ